MKEISNYEGGDEVKVAKKDSSYMFLLTPRFKFLDMRNYLASSQSIDGWCRFIDCAVQKLVFPYEWLKDYTKLETPCSAITWQDFISSLNRDKKIAKAAFKTFVTEYIEKRGFMIMRQVLEEYNKADVTPILGAVNKTQELYYPDKIDVLKDAVSISAMSMTYVLKKTLRRDKQLKFYALGGVCVDCPERKAICKACGCPGAIKSGKFCFDRVIDLNKIADCECKKTAVYELLKTGMVGGPFIVYWRYHEAGVTGI